VLDPRGDLLQDLQPLAEEWARIVRNTGKIVLRRGIAGDKARSQRIGNEGRDDGYRCGGLLGRDCRRGGYGKVVMVNMISGLASTIFAARLARLVTSPCAFSTMKAMFLPAWYPSCATPSRNPSSAGLKAPPGVRTPIRNCRPGPRCLTPPAGGPRLPARRSRPPVADSHIAALFPVS
jgi:hypothetical protein